MIACRNQQPRVISRRVRSLNRITTTPHWSNPKRQHASKPPSNQTTKQQSPPTAATPVAETAGDVPYQLPKAFCVGAFAGILGSLAGMGGGFVMIPLMTSSLLKLTQHQAHGTSLFAVAATGVAGALGYSGQVDVEAAVAISVSGMIMARAGAGMTATMSERSLKRALGVFMLLIAPLVPAKAYFMQIQDETRKKNIMRISNSNNELLGKGFLQRIGPPAVIGLGSGFLAGLFGVGGGAIVVPALTLCTDMTHYQALGTSLCAMALPAMVGTSTHFSKGNVAIRIAPTLALGSFVGAYLGGNLGLQTDETTLRWGFSSLMLFLGIRTLLVKA